MAEISCSETFFFLRPGFLGDSTGHRSGCTHRIVHRVFSFGFASFFSPVWFLSRVFFIVAGHRQVATRCAPGRCSRGVFNGRKIKCQKKRKKIEKETSAPKKPRTRIMADAGHTHTHTHTLTHTHTHTRKEEAYFFVVETVYKNGSPKKKRKATVRTMAVQRPVEEISGEKRERERERENEMKRQKKKCRSMGKWNFFFFLPPFRKPFRSSFRTDGNIRKSVRRVHIGR